MNNDYSVVDLRAAVASAAVHVPAVSNWSVGMHVHHCCLAMTRICESLNASIPPTPPSPFSMRTTVVLLSGRIPRGRGKAPDPSRPTEDASPEELGSLLDRCDQLLSEARALDSQHWFNHFAFGVLGRDKTLRFIGIHNRHHLRIIADIMSAQ